MLRVCVCRGVYVYLYIRERKGRGERDTEAERGRENNLPLYFWWWFISFPPLIFGFLCYTGCSESISMVSIVLTSYLWLHSYLPTNLSTHTQPYPFSAREQTWPAMAAHILQIRASKTEERRHVCRVGFGPLRYGDVARWQMRMECSLWTHRPGKGLPSKPVPCDYLKSAPMGFVYHTHFLRFSHQSHSVWTKYPPGETLHSSLLRPTVTHVIRAHDHHSFH